MTSRPVTAAAICAAILALLSAFPAMVERLAPAAGLTRSVFMQPGFAGVPDEARTSEINLRFLDAQTSLPRQNFSVRWRGFFYVSATQSIELFAGGNDEVELRVDGELLLTRNLREGMRTVGRRITLESGAHEIAVDYQQFGGGMALNIQRALEGRQPAPFSPTELFATRARWWHVFLLDTARWLRPVTPYGWLAVLLLFIGSVTVMNFSRWRATMAPQNAREYAARLQLIAAPALLAPAVVLIFGPHTIFATNTGEFAVSFWEIAAPWLLRAAIFNWLVLVAIGCAISVLSDGLTRVYAALLFAVGLFLWGQGNLWNADYGALAGREIDLGQNAARAPYELAVLAGMMLAAAVFFRPLSRIAPFASLVFICVQTGAAVISSAGPAAEQTPWEEPPAEIYRFSGTQNVIHIVLDEFQSDVFTDILEQDRASLDRQFSGFQYFTDHAGTFPTTSFSMPAMLTGHEYRNQQPAPEFVRDVFRRDSIFSAVSRAGYDVDAMSIVPLASFEQWLGTTASPNWKGARFRIRKPFLDREAYREVTARQLLELAMFRHAPHSAKVYSVERPDVFYRPIRSKAAESPAETRLHEAANSVAFLEHFITLMSVGRERPVYKLIHVGIPHRPIVVDRECRFLGVTAITRQKYGDQARCALKLVAALLDRARTLGIYDSSLIVVSSDHGTDMTPSGFNGESETLSSARGPAIPRLGVIAGTAKALMLIKPPASRGPIAISEAPTSHVDFHSTIVDLLGLEGGSSQASMFRRDSKQLRTRSFGMYDFRRRFPEEYLDRIHVLSLDRKVVDAAGWNADGTAWPPTATLPLREVDFLDPGSNAYLGVGWSMDRRERAGESGTVTFVQAMNRQAVVFVPSDTHELVLRARSSESGLVDVAIDGRSIGQLSVSAGGYRDYSVSLTPLSSRTPIVGVTLGFKTMPDEGRTFKLDRLIVR